MQVKAVFFDSGHTLMRPIGDRWFPGMRFFQLCREHGVAVADNQALENACDSGYAYLAAHHDDVPDVAAEQRQFRRYFRIVFERLAIDAPQALIADLAVSEVLDVNFEPYPATRRVLDSIKAMGLPMALLTDAWPSVRDKYRKMGFLDYFDSFVISAEEQCTKPDWGMFQPALTALNPSGTLFFDDSPDIISGSRALGFQAHLIDNANDGSNLASVLDLLS